MSEDEREFHWYSELWTGQDVTPPAGLDPVLMTLLLEHVSTRVAIVGRDWRYTYLNREALRFMGLPAEQVVGRHMSEVLDAGVYANFVPIFERLFAGDASLRLRGWVEYERQGRRFREQYLVPYSRDGGPVTHIVVCGVDHTEQFARELEFERQRAQLRASEALKSAIFDNALAALVSTDPEGRIVEFNPSAEAMFGRRRADVLGLPVGEVMIPERFRAAHDAGIARLRDGGDGRVLGRRMELPALRADGSEFPMEMVLWRTETGDSRFYTASIADLSERYAASQQIERQREALRQSEKLTAMGSLLAGVSHELNNPLAIVMGRASLLEEKCEGSPALLQDATRIREAAERCGRIVRTFLNMARSRPPRRERVMLADVVRAAADMLGYAYRSHGIELRLELDPALPALSADADQICQVLLNLLVNAQHALAAVDGARWVRVRTGAELRAPERRAGPRNLWLEVADNGPGIAEPARARIFEAFFTTKAEGLGTGMGLAVSRSLAREHGGELELQPATAEGGAVFRLTLPVGARIDDGTLADPAAGPDGDADGGADADDPTPERVLVVDDEAELSRVMREMLEQGGYEVATAESGEVALELLGAARFDAVVSDLRMPDMDGTALWRAIGERHPALATRLLFVTGDTLSPDAAAFLSISGCAVLEKPFAKADLLARVGALLRMR